MTEISRILFALALLCALAGVALMMAIARAVQARGYPVHWLWIRLYIPKYVHQYRQITVQESGRPGPLFYPFVVSMNAALVLCVVGIAIELA
jgi:hypothetical protein